MSQRKRRFSYTPVIPQFERNEDGSKDYLLLENWELAIELGHYEVFTTCLKLVTHWPRIKWDGQTKWVKKFYRVKNNMVSLRRQSDGQTPSSRRSGWIIQMNAERTSRVELLSRILYSAKRNLLYLFVFILTGFGRVWVKMCFFTKGGILQSSRPYNIL